MALKAKQQGIVTKSTGKWCQVLSQDNTTYNCTIQGKFRIKGLRSTNPVAVGDRVGFQLEEDQEGVISNGVIVEIEDRKNYIVRKSVNLSKQLHIIASNIDMCFLLITLKAPVTSTGFIDRFLISAEAFKVPVTILINKMDLHTEADDDYLDHIIQGYQNAGYEVRCISVNNNQGLDELKLIMQNNINMISGHSGVGKTSLLNAIEPDLELRTMEVSDVHSKGQHTTTFAEMYPLETGGFLIDTPGIKGFGLVDIDKDDLGHYFKDFFELLPACKFHNCRHLSEPKCAVKEAAKNGTIAPFRYNNYLNIYNSMAEDQTYRIDPYK